jgi:hypothetical protein
MANDSPIPKGRKPLERLVYIASPPVCPVIKRRVLSTPPPHGLSGSSPEVADSPFSRWDMDQRFRHRESRRELFLQNRLLEHQATEGRPGSSVEGSDNSGDDRWSTMCQFVLVESLTIRGSPHWSATWTPFQGCGRWVLRNARLLFRWRCWIVSK